MVSASDAASFVVGPANVVQVAGVLVVAACLPLPARPRRRAGLILVAAAAALLVSHRPVVDSLRGEIRDVCALVAIRRLPLDPMRESGLAPRWTAAGFEIGQEESGRALPIVSPPVVGLDRGALSHVSG